MKTRVYPYPISSRSPVRLGRGGLILLALAALVVARAQGATYTLGATNCWESPAAGSDSIVLGASAPSAPWTALANGTWLHLSPANQAGAGSANVIFTYDANPGATRTATLTVAGQTVTVTQAGATYVAAPGPLTTLVASGLYQPSGLAVDGVGNIYLADRGNYLIKKWMPANNTVTTVVSSGLYYPFSVAVDGLGGVYIADTMDNAIKKWTGNTLMTLVSSGLYYPSGVAVDGAGNVYFADSYNNAIKKWTATSGNVTTLISSGLSDPCGIAVDVAGNLYLADSYNNAVKKWTAASGAVSTLISGLNQPYGVAVDGSGNVYVADTLNNAVKKWTPVDGSVTTVIASGLNGPAGVAVDWAGNLYVANFYNNTIVALPRAFVDPTAKCEGCATGCDVMPPVLPPAANLLPPFAPSTDQGWLAVSGAANGIVSFSFAPNNGPARTGHLSLFGVSIPISQPAGPPALGTTNLVEGPTGGSDSVVLGASDPTVAWTAAANDPWLHLSPANQGGAGSANVIFTYDANPGATRTGTLTVADQTLTVTQAGATYVAAPGPLTTLVASGLYQPSGLAVDGVGNIYLADRGNYLIKKWMPANNTVTTVVSSGLYYPFSVAVDGLGGVYIADTMDNAIKKWTGNTLMTLVSSGLYYPSGVAVDGAGNVYFADSYNNAIKKWTATSGNVTTLISSGLSDPCGIAVDVAGNLYLADSYNNAVKKWTAASGAVSTLISGLNQPYGVAVDGSGNVYVADTLNNAVKKWTPVDGSVTTVIASGLNGPAGVAVDWAGNLYVANFYNNTIVALPRAFVDPTAKSEGACGGCDALPAVLPATVDLLPPFAPTSDQAWLTLGGITNGAVSFAVCANTNPAARSAHVSLFGQSIAITQAAPVAPPTLLSPMMLGSGGFQLVFTSSNPNASFTVLSATNPALPLASWDVLGAAVSTTPGTFQFSTTVLPNEPQRFFRVRSP